MIHGILPVYRIRCPSCFIGPIRCCCDSVLRWSRQASNGPGMEEARARHPSAWTPIHTYRQTYGTYPICAFISLGRMAEVFGDAVQTLTRFEIVVLQPAVSVLHCDGQVVVPPDSPVVDRLPITALEPLRPTRVRAHLGG